MLAAGAGKRELAGTDLLGLPLVELVSPCAQIDGDFPLGSFAGIEQPHSLTLELCGESLTLDHLTPSRELSLFKDVRQTRAISEPLPRACNGF